VNSERKGRSLRKIALDFLARREHSEQELRSKLNARHDDSEAVDAVLWQLKEEHLQSDERFTESYVNHRFNAGIGPLKIRHELRQKGIGDLLIDSYLEPLVGEWEPMMRHQRARKFGETLPDDYSARMKQARFLQNRGFSPESVMRLFR
jgi:regulatory protein